MNKNQKRVIILIFLIPIWIGLYFYLNWFSLNKNSMQYENVVKNTLIKVDKKNQDLNYKTFVEPKLLDLSLIPYVDKAKMKLKRQINVVCSKEKKQIENNNPCLEILEFNNESDVAKMYEYIENKVQYKIDKKQNKLLFINIVGKNEEKVRQNIISELKKVNENFE